MTTFDFGTWDVESLRLSIFHSGLYDLGPASNLWNRVTGLEPDSVDLRSKDRIVRSVGIVGRDTLILVVQDGRTDWTLQATSEPPPQSSNEIIVPKIKSYESALPIFTNALDYSLEAMGSISRIAFAPLLIWQVDTPGEGMVRLSNLLPNLDLPTQQSGDLVYQLNRIQRSKVVPHAGINRIARWSLEALGSVSFRLGPTGQPDVLPATLQPVVRLMLDINTTQNTNAISKKKVPELFNELVALSEKVAREGDVS